MGHFRAGEQMRRATARVLKYKTPSHGSKQCSCGRTISQTADKCFACSVKPAEDGVRN